MRRRALLLLLAVAALPVAALPTAGGSRATDASFYAVEPDPRMCPSPLCGGYWVSLANHGRTRCVDGLEHPRCYVARAASASGAPVTIPGQTLVRGRLEPGHDDLGILVVARVFEPVGKAKSEGRYFRLRDTGIRCVRAPCFSMRALHLNGSARTPVSGLVLSTLGRDGELERRVLGALASTGGVLTRGRIARTGIGGRELYATRFYLRSRG